MAENEDMEGIDLDSADDDNDEGKNAKYDDLWGDDDDDNLNE